MSARGLHVLQHGIDERVDDVATRGVQGVDVRGVQGAHRAGGYAHHGSWVARCQVRRWPVHQVRGNRREVIGVGGEELDGTAAIEAHVGNARDGHSIVLYCSPIRLQFSCCHWCVGLGVRS